MQAQWKLSRALGVANVAIVHRISDLGAVGASGSEAVALARGLLADCSTRIVYAQESDQVEATASALGLSDVEADQLVHLPRGRGLWRIGQHAAIVDHVLSSTEYSLVDTDSQMRGASRTARERRRTSSSRPPSSSSGVSLLSPAPCAGWRVNWHYF
jgi:hypothetical protein